jgi:dihydroorotate dehydrogenase electron transfer subunit
VREREATMAATDATAVVKSRSEDCPGVVRLVLHLPGAAATCMPGQFLMIEPCEGAFPVVRRPFTVSDADPAGGTVEVVFQVVGEGTGMLAGLSPGEGLRVLGPLGRGWQPAEGSWLLVGGGLGSAGFPLLRRSVRSAAVLVGARTASLLPRTPEGAFVATEDGSLGKRGLVTDLLDAVDPSAFDAIAVCGPLAMMSAVAARLSADSLGRTQVSMESRMACGWGACGGCPVPSSGGGYLKCCTDGPVFRAGEIDWAGCAGVLP